nr:MAG TPA: hypothetical protein [Caudoviricetes sp.]
MIWQQQYNLEKTDKLKAVTYRKITALFHV